MTIDVMWFYLYPGIAGLFCRHTPLGAASFNPPVEIGGPLLPAPSLASLGRVCGVTRSPRRLIAPRLVSNGPSRQQAQNLRLLIPSTRAKSIWRELRSSR